MELLQHMLVTLVAFGAATVVVRRVFSTFAPAAERPRCGACGPSSPGGRPCAAPPPLIQLSGPSGDEALRPSADH